MLLLNAVVLSVIVMLALSLARVHVVISLFVASVVAGLVAGMGIPGTMSLSKPASPEAQRLPFHTHCSALSPWLSLTQVCRPCLRAQL